jgi:hypothetical protein
MSDAGYLGEGVLGPMLSMRCPLWQNSRPLPCMCEGAVTHPRNENEPTNDALLQGATVGTQPSPCLAPGNIWWGEDSHRLT